ncbi:MAG: CRISPR-associated endonuclease Cas2 [Thioploca sp.]|nr:CRISPR-associated endonuclease Cas2 [Thioploca sp.]
MSNEIILHPDIAPTAELTPLSPPEILPTVRVGEYPYLFAYDIINDNRRNHVFKTLQRWRVDGQYSVHETWLRPPQVRDLSVELLNLIDRKQDSLIVGRLAQHQCHPIYQVSINQNKVPLMGKPRPIGVPRQLGYGWYLFCYDVREAHRLQRIQRTTAQYTLYLQRSVYLYQGKGLLELVSRVYELMEADDDLRIYSLSGAQDLWFLSHDRPVLLQKQPSEADITTKPTGWQRFLNWIRR